MTNSKLVLLRHGESIGNRAGFFTGRLDVDLTGDGKNEAYSAGEALRGMEFDRAYTSELLRATRTLDVVLEVLGQKPIVTRTPNLNERDYGILTGVDRNLAEAKFGKEQIQKWRRSYREGPPDGESIKDISERVISFYNNSIVPHLKRGENVLIVAHAGSLLPLAMMLDGIDENHIANIRTPNCIPVIYELDGELKVVEKMSGASSPQKKKL